MSSPSASQSAAPASDSSKNLAALKQLRIQCGVVRRLAKEVSMYQMEAADLLVDFQQMKVAVSEAGSSLTADDERAHRLRKQQEVLRESQMMVPDTQRRLVAARSKLAELLIQHQGTCSGEAEFLEAKAELAQEDPANAAPTPSPPAVIDTNNVAALKQLRIQAGVVRRLAKEVEMYQSESAALLAELEEMKTAAIEAGSSMTADDERAHRLRKQQEVLRESQMMVPDTQRRLMAARDKMTELLRQHEAACSGEAEFLEAKAEMAQGDGPALAN